MSTWVPQPRNTGLRLRGGVGGTKCLLQRGQVAKSLPKAVGHPGCRAVLLSLFPSGEGKEGSGLGQEASCPAPSCPPPIRMVRSA